MYIFSLLISYGQKVKQGQGCGYFSGHDIGQRVEKMSEMEHVKLSEASLPLLHTDLKHPTNWKHPEKYLQVTDVIKTSPPNRKAKFPQS